MDEEEMLMANSWSNAGQRAIIAACKTSAHTSLRRQNISAGQSASLAAGPKAILAPQICREGTRETTREATRETTRETGRPRGRPHGRPRGRPHGRPCGRPCGRPQSYLCIVFGRAPKTKVVGRPRGRPQGPVPMHRLWAPYII
jgi:hypothetical protein